MALLGPSVMERIFNWPSLYLELKDFKYTYAGLSLSLSCVCVCVCVCVYEHVRTCVMYQFCATLDLYYLPRSDLTSVGPDMLWVSERVDVLSLKYYIQLFKDLLKGLTFNEEI